jgi:hypothetical protein
MLAVEIAKISLSTALISPLGWHRMRSWWHAGRLMWESKTNAEHCQATYRDGHSSNRFWQRWDSFSSGG